MTAAINSTGARKRVYPFFFFNDTATTEIYTLSLHDALPISSSMCSMMPPMTTAPVRSATASTSNSNARSEEHTSELQSQSNLVCRLLLEKKKNKINKRMKASVCCTTHHNMNESLKACTRHCA